MNVTYKNAILSPKTYLNNLKHEKICISIGIHLKPKHLKGLKIHGESTQWQVTLSLIEGEGGHSPPIELPLFSKFGFKDYLEAPSGNRTQDWLITILSDQNYASTQNSIFSKYFNSWISEGHLNKDNYSLSQRFR